MSGVNNRTLELDKLYVRDIIYKFPSNQPVPANQILYSRGDGGTYFGNIPSENSTFTSAFNTFQAGSSIITASGSSNTFSLQPGAGINFYIDSNKHVNISASAPDQIVTDGGQSLNFSSLRDTLTGGRTLYFAGEGDTYINVSDTTIVFGSQYISTMSSLQELISSVSSLYATQSTLAEELSTIFEIANALYISTNVSTLFYTVNETNALVTEMSSFIYSTFSQDTEGNYTVLNINQINANDIEVYNVDASKVKTYSLKVGSNTLYDMNLPGDVPQDCTVITSTGAVSTYTNFFNIKDNYTNVDFALAKEYMVSQSTFGKSTFQTFGEQVQLGWFPYLSSQGIRLPSTLRSQFVPILQQIEVLEQTLVSTSTGPVSTITNYSLQNIVNADAICATNQLNINASRVMMSSLYVSSINGLPPGSGPGPGPISGSSVTASTIYTDRILPLTSAATLTINSFNASSIKASTASILTLLTSTVRAPVGVFSTITASSATASVGSFSTLNVSSLNLGSGVLSTLINNSGVLSSIRAGIPSSISSLALSSFVFGSASGSTLNVSTLRFGNGSASSITATLGNFSSMQANSIFFNTLVGSSLTVSSLNYSRGTMSSIVVSSIYYNNGATSSLLASSIQAVNTVTQQAFVTGITGNNGNFLTVSTGSLGYLTGNGRFTNTVNLSTGKLTFNNASGTSVSASQGNFGPLSASTFVTSDITANTLGVSTITAQIINVMLVSSFYSSTNTEKVNTLYAQTAYVSTLRLSTLMGQDLPIFTFDAQNRRVGVNLGPTQQPRATMDVAGIVYASNFVTTSDRRLKSDIQTMKAPTTIPQSYRYRHSETGEEDIGVMADEIEQFAPECVYTRPDGYKAVSYMKLVPVCFSLIQALSERLEVLETERANNRM